MVAVELRPWQRWDAANYAYMLNHVDFSYLEDTYLEYRDARAAKRHIEQALSDEEQRGDLYRAVIVNGVLAGEVQVVSQYGVHHIDAFLGCILMEEYTGRGVGYQACRQIIEMAFEKNDYQRLTAQVYDPNKASIGMLEKLGFAHEVTLRNGVRKDENVYDVHVYGLLREDFS